MHVAYNTRSNGWGTTINLQRILWFFYVQWNTSCVFSTFSQKNVLAKRMVQTTKEVFLKQLLHDVKNQPNRTLQHKIDSYLFTYRNTPHSTTGHTPSNYFWKLNLELFWVGKGNANYFNEGEKVYVRTVRQEQLNSVPGVITKIVTPVTYLIKVEGRTRFVHADHLKHKHTQKNTQKKINRSKYTEEDLFYNSINLKLVNICIHQIQMKKNKECYMTLAILNGQM